MAGLSKLGYHICHGKDALECAVTGRILFAQCIELINAATSRGLPRILLAAEVSESFISKGTDILIVSLVSELGFHSNPVASHVQGAEMDNQAVNLLALISARYTLDSLEMQSQLVPPISSLFVKSWALSSAKNSTVKGAKKHQVHRRFGGQTIEVRST